MKTYMQFKDGVAFAHITSSAEVTDGVEVDPTVADSYLNKKYVNGSWVDAEKITYVVLNNDRSHVVEVKHTVFSSEIKEDEVVSNNPNVLVGWSYDGTNFNEPTIIEPVPVEVIREVIREVAVHPELLPMPE